MTPLLDTAETRPSKTLLPAPKGSVDVPPAPFQQVRNCPKASSPLLGRVYLRTFLRSLLMGIVVASSGLTPQCILLGSSQSPQPTVLLSGMDTARLKPDTISRRMTAPIPQKYRPTAAFRPATAAPRPPPPERTDLRGFNYYKRRRKGTSPHTFVSFLGRTSVTTVECTDTRSWTPCTGPSQFHRE